jgi:UDP-2-acetamido-3-amino-2,3-dideoxy-glucuronate N-acetyltransferase
MSSRSDGVVVHPTALVEDGVTLGAHTKVWDNVHIRRGAKIGERCIIGEKTYIAYDVVIGDLVKINAAVYICANVTIEDMVMLSAHTVFTNDVFPRAALAETREPITSDPTEETLHTTVRQGVTVGANATIGPGVELGQYAMVGMGSVVTRDVTPFQLVVGNPARPIGWVCMCGHPLARAAEAPPAACRRSTTRSPCCMRSTSRRDAWSDSFIRYRPSRTQCCLTIPLCT